MKKLLLLPLVVLLFSCRNSKPVASAATNQDATMEQPTGDTPKSPQPPLKAAPVTNTEQVQEGQQASIKQGIAGKVVWLEGNQMPSPDAPRRSGKRGVQRTLYIYELTKGSQATATEGVFYKGIKTKLVAEVVTDANGNFAVSLAPGKYSLFSKEEQGLFANLMDGDGNINPIEVQEGQVTSIEFSINYKASY